MKSVVVLAPLCVFLACSSDDSGSGDADASDGFEAGGDGAIAGGTSTGGRRMNGGSGSGAGNASNGGSSPTGGSGGNGSGGGNSSLGGRASTGGTSFTGGNSSLGGSSATGGVSSSGGNSANGGNSSNGGGSSTGGSSSTGGNASTGGSSSTGGSGSGGSETWNAGNPGTCAGGVPAEGQPVNTSSPTTVVGTGTAASCTFGALRDAVVAGGIVTFDCGGAATISVTATINVPTNKDTVIDGGKMITLDGNHNVRILNFNSPGWQTNDHRLTLQHIKLVNAKATPTEAIPPAPEPCSQGWNDGEGGAIFMRDGNLTVIDSIFSGNRAAPLGPDTGGGAIYVMGSMRGVVIAGSSFTDNAASNAGAVGGLFAELHIYDSLFSGNKGLGNGANNNDPSKCSAMNNGQNEIGSGGNGGAIYSDGIDVNVVLCGNRIVNNAAGMGAFGGGLFFTSNNYGGTLTIADTTMTGNTGGSWTNVSTGNVTSAGTAVGTNCKSITLQNSTLQGVP